MLNKMAKRNKEKNNDNQTNGANKGSLSHCWLELLYLFRNNPPLTNPQLCIL